jgi:hypothetical protein
MWNGLAMRRGVFDFFVNEVTHFFGRHLKILVVRL